MTKQTQKVVPHIKTGYVWHKKSGLTIVTKVKSKSDKLGRNYKFILDLAGLEFGWYAPASFFLIQYWLHLNNWLIAMSIDIHKQEHFLNI